MVAILARLVGAIFFHQGFNIIEFLVYFILESLALFLKPSVGFNLLLLLYDVVDEILSFGFYLRFFGFYCVLA